MDAIQSPLLTFGEAARYCRLDAENGKGEKTIKRYCSRGKLKSTRIGNNYFVHVKELDSFIEQRQRKENET